MDPPPPSTQTYGATLIRRRDWRGDGRALILRVPEDVEETRYLELVARARARALADAVTLVTVVAPLPQGVARLQVLLNDGFEEVVPPRVFAYHHSARDPGPRVGAPNSK
jgi:hypothetical protein